MIRAWANPSGSVGLVAEWEKTTANIWEAEIYAGKDLVSIHRTDSPVEWEPVVQWALASTSLWRPAVLVVYELIPRVGRFRRWWLGSHKRVLRIKEQTSVLEKGAFR